MSINSAKTLNHKDNYVQIINGKAALTQKTHQGINPATLVTTKPSPILYELLELPISRLSMNNSRTL
ncbi:hypothetical protein HZ326_11908 [Fusarium oxysporum f. sp. albedinis]|nr:hypothetical protein HZ326_11908 [Fusarium oxysporum f. sp. albedinis]